MLSTSEFPAAVKAFLAVNVVAVKRPTKNARFTVMGLIQIASMLLLQRYLISTL